MICSVQARRCWRQSAIALLALVGLAVECRAEDTTVHRPDSGHAAPTPPGAEESNAGKEAPLPLPSTLNVHDYEVHLFKFLQSRKYRELGWAVDKGVRDTGPFIDGKAYGTHPAVRIYYSPAIIEWLQGGMKRAIPDGAMMIKEQFKEPAARYDDLDESQLWARLTSWAVMVKDSAGAHDGWFWSNPAKNQRPVDCFSYPFEEPVSGFGLYCVRCHASTKTHGETNEYTFASLRNVQGFPGEPLRFNIDDSWLKDLDEEDPLESVAAPGDVNEPQLAKSLDLEPQNNHPRCTDATNATRCAPVLNEAFLATFPSIAKRPRGEVAHLTPVTHDWTVRRTGPSRDQQAFVTSNQCMSCHAGLLGPFGPAMFHLTGDDDGYGAEGRHLSPYGEWRWTPMGLAGRDPIFYAQLESELALIRQDLAGEPERADELAQELTATCLRCHGVMGSHQFHLDHGDGAGKFGLELVHQASTDKDAVGARDWRYGALARDGVSCTVCHTMEAREQPADDERSYLEFFLETSITGNIHIGKTGEMHGPFLDKEVAPYAMEHALGYKPTFNPYIKSSQLCGTCHVVNLPIVDQSHVAGHGDELIASEQNPAFKEFHHHVEQATYLEWLNSEFQNEIGEPGEQARSCQQCHMAQDCHDDAEGLHLDNVATRMAAIQDNTYPDAENLASREELEIRRRKEGFARHNFRGLNVFLLEMFNQFDDVLGVRKFDYMTGSTKDIQHAMADFRQLASRDVATLTVEARATGPREITAQVLVKNQVGHRFPSGVGFRRAFLEVLVLKNKENTAAGKPEPTDEVLWASGQTNDLGLLIDERGEVLATEFFNEDAATGQQAFQPHHVEITSPAQVQVYETLLRNSQGRFTTSFVRGSDVVKDNRLLPRGWKKEGPGPELKGEFLRATYPDAETMQDPSYVDGSGSDGVLYRIQLPKGVDPRNVTVKATLHYQAIPPYFLKNLFETAPHGPATQRLHYICSNMDLRSTGFKQWKLPIVSASAGVE